MDRAYIVEVYFEDFDSSYWRVVGIYTDSNSANEALKKWKRFYKKSKKVFNQPKDFTPIIYKDYGNETHEDWSESDEYYRLIGQYSDIKLFSNVTIREFDLNKDILIENSKEGNTEQMITLMRQWDRDYKLNKLTE